MQSAEWYKMRAYLPSFTEADKTVIRNDWETITGTDFNKSFNTGCPNCYHDAIILIILTMDKKDNGGYILKRGIAFRCKGKIYTCNNLTADAAEWYIRQDLKHRDDFEELAKDYDSYAATSTLPVKNGEQRG